MREIYGMIDGMPIWQHLSIDAKQGDMRLIGHDFGEFAETLGKRVLRKLIRKGGILDDLFHNICILSTSKIKKVVIMGDHLYHNGDFALEVHYKDDKGFGKKIVIFEIKHGHFQIEQHQLRRYCFMIKEPGEYFDHADEVRIVFLMFTKIDTMNCSASYSIGELKKELATKILDSFPIDIDNYVRDKEESTDGYTSDEYLENEEIWWKNFTTSIFTS